MESRYLFRSRTLPSFPFCRSQPPYPLPPSLLASPIHHWCAASRISSSPHHEHDSALPPPRSLASSRSRQEVLHVAAILFPTIQTTNHTHASSASWRCCIESSFCPKTSVETVTPPWSLDSSGRIRQDPVCTARILTTLPFEDECLKRHIFVQKSCSVILAATCANENLLSPLFSFKKCQKNREGKHKSLDQTDVGDLIVITLTIRLSSDRFAMAVNRTEHVSTSVPTLTLRSTTISLTKALRLFGETARASTSVLVNFASERATLAPFIRSFASSRGWDISHTCSSHLFTLSTLSLDYSSFPGRYRLSRTHARARAQTTRRRK